MILLTVNSICLPTAERCRSFYKNNFLSKSTHLYVGCFGCKSNVLYWSGYGINDYILRIKGSDNFVNYRFLYFLEYFVYSDRIIDKYIDIKYYYFCIIKIKFH